MPIDAKKQAEFFARHPEITRVTPCRDKSPEFRKSWNTEPLTPEQLLRDWPGESFGQVAGPDDLILDFDDKTWFYINAPSVPETLVIEGRGVRIHARHNDRTRKWVKRKVKNPDSESEWLLEFPNFAVLPPSVHPVTGKEYKEYIDKPISELSPDWMDFIERLLGERNQKANVFRKNPLKQSWSPEIELPAAGLKFEKSLRDGKVYFNYGWDCRFAGRTHEQNKEKRNQDCSAFVFNPANRDFWHYCFVCGYGSAKTPLATLGLELETVLEPAENALLDSWEDFENEPKFEWVIDRLFEKSSFNIIAGLSGGYKSWWLMMQAYAQIIGLKLFDNFQCVANPEGALYLVPEVGRGSFKRRAQLIRAPGFSSLYELIREGRLKVRTLSAGPIVNLSNPQIRKLAEGRDVFLDTAVRFLEGDENASADNNLAEQGFGLIRDGARTVTGAHHSPKDFEKASKITLENVLRGTGDIGAMLSNCIGGKKLDEATGLVHWEQCKGREVDEENVLRFQLTAKPWINKEGRFHMTKPPTECKSLAEETQSTNGGKGGRPKKAKDEEIAQLHDVQGLSWDKIGEKLGLSPETVRQNYRIHKKSNGGIEFPDLVQEPDGF
jgi:AAA domain